MKFEWRNLYRGLMMGISDLIPGVSGGTIAVILGIYERLLEAISGFFSKDWKRHIGFLVPLALGMGTALLAFSKLMEYLLNEHPQPTHYFFMGLVIGVVPLLFKQADVRRNFSAGHVLVLLVSAIIVASMAWFRSEGTSDVITDFNLLTYIGLFFSGWLASVAMLLPGISGSFILLILGVYPTALSALSTLNFTLIAVIGLGVIIGFIVSSKGIQYLLKHHIHMTLASVIGLVVGSIFLLYPGIPNQWGTGIISVLLFLVGFMLVQRLGKKS